MPYPITEGGVYPRVGIPHVGIPHVGIPHVGIPHGGKPGGVGKHILHRVHIRA